MGRIGADASHHQQEIAAGDPPPPPPPLEEDLYEPPDDYQPPTKTSKPPPPQPQVHFFPPPQQQTPQQFPPNQNYNNVPQQNQNFQPQQMNNNNVNTHQGVPAMGFAPSPLLAHQNLLQINQLQNQPWKTHLFDCMKDPQNALITLFFPCVTFGQIAEVVDNGSTSCATSGILYSLIAFCIAMPCLISCGYRSKLRAKFGLVESPAPDFLIHCFCEYCALCQEYRELNDRGFDPSIGHAGNVAKQQHQRLLQQFGMTPPMQQRMN